MSKIKKQIEKVESQKLKNIRKVFQKENVLGVSKEESELFEYVKQVKFILVYFKDLRNEIKNKGLTFHLKIDFERSSDEIKTHKIENVKYLEINFGFIDIFNLQNK